MSRIRAQMRRLQLVEPLSPPQEHQSNWVDTTLTGWQAQGSSWQVQESLLMLQSSESLGNEDSPGSANQNSPFGSSMVH